MSKSMCTFFLITMLLVNMLIVEGCDKDKEDEKKKKEEEEKKKKDEEDKKKKEEEEKKNHPHHGSDTGVDKEGDKEKCKGKHQGVFKDHGDVIILTNDNFHEHVQKKIALLLFCANWSQHCQQMWEGFKKAAADLKNNDPMIRLMYMDCETYKQTCDKHKINAYPTMQVFKNGDYAHEYKGADRREASIVKYMKEVAKEPCKKDGKEEKKSEDKGKKPDHESEDKKGSVAH